MQLVGSDIGLPWSIWGHNSFVECCYVSTSQQEREISSATVANCVCNKRQPVDTMGQMYVTLSSAGVDQINKQIKK